MNEKFTPAPWIYQDGDNFEKEAVITTEGRLDKILNSAQPASDFYEEADALLAKARGEV